MCRRPSANSTVSDPARQIAQLHIHNTRASPYHPGTLGSRVLESAILDRPRNQRLDLRNYSTRRRVLRHRWRRLHRLAPVRAPARQLATMCCASTTTSPAPSSNVADLPRQPALRADAPRRDVPALCRGRRDLQPRLPGLADPLPARSGADDQDQRAWRHQHAGPGQARAAPKIFQASTSEVYGDPTVHPQVEELLAATSIRIGPRACYDEGKRCAETLFFDYHRQHKLRIKVARIFNTYGPRMHPNDGRVVSNFIVQALKGEDITIYGDGSQTRSFCCWTISWKVSSA